MTRARSLGTAHGPALAVDIGGTKLAVGIVEPDGTIACSSVCPTPATDPAALWAALAGLIERASRWASEACSAAPVVCGVGCGGPMAPGGTTVSPLNIPAWRSFPLRSQLEDHTGLPVAIDNDAKALALAEGWCGAARGVGDYMAMVVSTGVGGGIVVDGCLLDGGRGNAGHVGHVIVAPGGAVCACGASGCLEAEISGPAIARRTGTSPELARNEERVRAGTLLGRGVASVVNLLDLDVVLVGGSVALGFGDTFFDAARAELARCSRLSFSLGARLEPVGLGAEGPLVGAAAVGFASLFDGGRRG